MLSQPYQKCRADKFRARFGSGRAIRALDILSRRYFKLRRLKLKPLNFNLSLQDLKLSSLDLNISERQLKAALPLI